MWYVEVFVAHATYHKDEPLTYASDSKLQPGQIVLVPLRNKEVLAIVTAIVPKPSFAAKPIIASPDIPLMPKPLCALLAWMRRYYPAPLGLTTQLFLPDALAKKMPNRVTITAHPMSTKLPALTSDQQAALDAIAAPGTHILHGDTGTGKTRIYLELAKRSFAAGASSIILTPEIGLTSQLAQTFRSIFGDRVVVLHSGLTNTARREAWQTVLEAKEPLIVIGARSALFAPLANLGLIVVDESHETAYKQDQAPYYHASSVAAKLASLHGSTLVLGSATPLVSDYYFAQAKNRPVIRMQQIAAANISYDTASIEVVDLKDRSQFTKSSFLSVPLVQAIKQRLEDGEQILLYLNRRGTARVVFCENCGWQAVCPHCDLPLVYHGDSHVMRCHSCSYKAAVLSSCPQCKSSDIVFRSIGTKAIMLEAKRLFPEARVMRFDTDNRKNERLEALYDSVRAGDVDILVGTQTLAKGLDLPKLGLVGVVIADTSLYFPDFSAQERTYQLLSQVLGRVSRGHRQGGAIIQTYSPDSALLNSVIQKNWNNFYNKELIERKNFMFPPFCYLLKVTCKRASSQAAQKAAEAFATKVRSHNHNVIVEGPAPAFHEKVQNKFAWQLIIKAKNREQLTSIIRQLPSGWSHDIDPMNLL
jgi:primosomal protein N' (replication factor Y)